MSQTSMNPKYIYRKSDSKRFTLQEDGYYTLDASLGRSHRYTFSVLDSDDFTWKGKSIGLTEGEKQIVETLADSWNKYLVLEHQEFANAIHTCQYLIAKRVAARVDSDFWTQFD